MRLGGFARHVFFIFLQFEDVLSSILSIFLMFDGTFNFSIPGAGEDSHQSGKFFKVRISMMLCSKVSTWKLWPSVPMSWQPWALVVVGKVL